MALRDLDADDLCELAQFLGVSREKITEYETAARASYRARHLLAQDVRTELTRLPGADRVKRFSDLVERVEAPLPEEATF